MSSFPENYGLVAVALQGAFGILMAFRLTQLRVAKTPTTSTLFKTWHAVQLNVAEYNPTLMVLYAVLHFAARLSNQRLSTSAELAITTGLVSQVLFTIGAVGFTTQPNPARILGALSRYISIAWMCYEVSQLQ